MKKQLKDVLGTPGDGSSLRWEVRVPICTNPFMMVELVQLSFVGAALVLVTLASGLWFFGGGIAPGDIRAMVDTALVSLAALVAGFAAVSFLFYGNSYLAVFHLTPKGVYHQGIRGHDGSKGLFYWSCKPGPVKGALHIRSSREKDLPWEKVDGFTDFPGMRSVQLKRGRWHMLRLYTPDDATHAKVVAYLHKRLRSGSAGDAA